MARLGLGRLRAAILETLAGVAVPPWDAVRALFEPLINARYPCYGSPNYANGEVVGVGHLRFREGLRGYVSERDKNGKESGRIQG